MKFDAALFVSPMSSNHTTVSFAECIGKKTLILGDTNTGKTRLTEGLLLQAAERADREVGILDFAPGRFREIGGKMETPDRSSILYLTVHIVPPRLTGRDPLEIESYASQNARRIEALFSVYLKHAKPVLVINDVSLYLQKGKISRLLEALDSAGTAIINGYYGKALGQDPFSLREREQMDRLAAFCDRVVHL